jgi:hypothetical protein
VKVLVSPVVCCPAASSTGEPKATTNIPGLDPQALVKGVGEPVSLSAEGWFGEALDRVGPELAGKTLWRNHTDSWEAASQNRSPRFRDEFIRRRG